MRSIEDRARRQSRLPRLHVGLQAGQRPGDAKLVAEMKGKKMPQVGRVEVSIMEEDQARLLAFQNGELDLMNMEGPLAPNVLDGGKLKPEFAEQGRQAVALRRSRDQLHVLEHAGPGRRRPREGEDRAAPRDGDGVQRRRGDQRHPQRPGGRGAVSRFRRAWSATTRTTSRSVKLRPGAAPTRCSTGSATRKAPTAGARCRTASRCRSATRRAPIRSAASWTSCGRRRSTRSASGWKCRRTSSPSC